MGSGPRFGFLMRLLFLISSEARKLHVETWGGAQECPSPGRFPGPDFPAGCASVSFPACCSVLTSVLPGPGSEIENNWVGHNWRKKKESGVWFSGVPFKGRIFFHPLPFLETVKKKGS